MLPQISNGKRIRWILLVVSVQCDSKVDFTWKRFEKWVESDYGFDLSARKFSISREQL
jgi:hypothetical protein